MSAFYVVPLDKGPFKIEGKGHQTFEAAVKAGADQLGDYAIASVTIIAYSKSPHIQQLAESLANG